MDMFELRASVLKSLAHPARLRIFDLLFREGEKCVCDIADQLQISQPMTSKHVAMLKNVGLLQSRKEGSLVFYKIGTPCIGNIFGCLDASIMSTLQNKRNIIDNFEEESGCH